jgi:hypothetical protein
MKAHALCEGVTTQMLLEESKTISGALKSIPC